MNDTRFVKKVYNTGGGGQIINISAAEKMGIRVIPKKRFENSLKQSFFVRRKLIEKQLTIMSGFHPRLGENSPFRQVLSKDVARWWLKHFVTVESQCFVTHAQPKVWTTNQLYENDEIDLIFSDLDSTYNNNTLSMIDTCVPHFITNNLVMHPIILQTPRIGVCESNFTKDNTELLCIFNPKDKSTLNFKEVIKWIDVRCKEWIFMNLRDFIPYNIARQRFMINNNVSEHEYYNNYNNVNNVYADNTLVREDIPTYNLTSQSSPGLRLKCEKNPCIFNKDGSKFRGNLAQFLNVDPHSYNSCPYSSDNIKWIRCIIILDSLIVCTSGVVPYWKVLHIQPVQAPKTPVEYCFDSDSE